MSDSEKQAIVVTGGSRGIGRAICLSFASPATHIYFNYLSSSASADETKNLITEAGGSSTAIKVNITSSTEVNDFFKYIKEHAGRIDVLVNNAGITKDGLIVRMKEADWDSVIDTNLKGAFLCSKAALKIMIRQHCGSIINISSLVGISGNAGQANYVSSKAGLIGLTKAIAKEVASRNITVNAVAPGYIESDMTENLSDKIKTELVKQIPLGRVGTPQEIAHVVNFLASKKARYITGQVINVNGGIYI